MIGVAFLLALVAAPCHCPQVANSRDLILVARSPISGTGFVACGYTDDRRGEVFVASEFEIFSCEEEGRGLLTLGATETALLRVTSAELEITEISNWPFGDQWEWVEVPVYKWRLAYGAETAPDREVVLTPPQVSKERLDELHEWYQHLIHQSLEARAERSEEAVGRLFAAVLSGDKRFAQLFSEMTEAMSLDGHAGEVYSEAQITLASHREAAARKRHAKR